MKLLHGNAAVEGEGHVPLNEALAVVSEGQQEAAAALFAAPFAPQAG